MYDIGIPEIRITKRLQSDDGRAIKYLAESATRPERCSFPDA